MPDRSTARFIRDRNIANFIRQIAACTDEARRGVLQGLLRDERSKGGPRPQP